MSIARAILIAAPVLLLTLLGYWYLSSQPPSDRALEDRFRSREAELQRLVSMFQEDAQAGEVTPEAAYLPYSMGHEKRRVDLSPERLSEYRRLLKKNALSAVQRGGGGRIYLEAFASDYEQWKGYVYTESAPAPLVDTLNDFQAIGRSPALDSTFTRSGYKKISDNWYLYLTVFTG